jgi:transcriptional regulator with XRE-family HTH domain
LDVFFYQQIMSKGMSEGTSIGKRLEEIRLFNGLTRTAFAESVGIDRSQYSRVESGKIIPTSRQMCEISSKYNVSTDWIFFGDGSMLKKTAPSHAVEEEKKEVSIAPEVDSSSNFLEVITALARENGKLEGLVEQLTSQVAMLKAENENLKNQRDQPSHLVDEKESSFDWLHPPVPMVDVSRIQYKIIPKT